MSHIQCKLGFELTYTSGPDNYLVSCGEIYEKAKAFIATQEKGSRFDFSTRNNRSGAYAHVLLHVVTKDLDEAKIKQNQIATALEQLPSPIPGAKGKSFQYHETAVTSISAEEEKGQK